MGPGRLDGDGPVPRAVTILERERAVHAVEAVLDGAQATSGAAIFVVAEAGIGKTTVIDEAQSRARARGLSVRFARCAEVETSIPFALIDRLFEGTGASVQELTRGSASPGDALARRYVELLDWLSARPSPLLLAIDDLHWSDPDSTTLLAALCRRLGERSIAVIATLRPWPASALEQARRLVDDGIAGLVHLEPLSDEASRTLLEACLGADTSPAVATRACASCAGNPLLLKEVANAWRRGDDLVASPAALGHRVFLPRFTGVSPAAMRWARGASVLGSRFRPLLVTALVGQNDLEATGGLEELCHAGIVRATSGPEAEFVHPLLRHALYEDIAVPVRQGLHARVFTLLQRIGASPAELAVHAVAGDLRGDPGAIAAVIDAARGALDAGATATASDLFGSAIELAGTAAPVSLWLECSRANLLQGRIDEAERAVRRYLADPTLDGPERVDGLRLLAQLLMASARVDDALHCFEQAARVASEFDVALAGETLLDATFTASVYRGPSRVRTNATRVLELIERHGLTDDALRTAAASAETYLACISGEHADIEALATAALTFARDPNIHDLRAAGNWNPVVGYVRLAKLFERFDDEMSVYPVLDDLARRQGSTLTQLSYALNHADTLWRTGRLEDAYRTLHDAMSMSVLFPAIEPHASIGLCYLAHELGRHAESAEWARRVESIMAVQGETAYLRLWLLLIACRNALSDGHLEAALEAASRAAAVAAASGILEPCVVPWHGVAIDAYVAAGRLDEAWALTASLDALCERLPCHTPRAVAAAGRAGVHWRRGEVDAAEACFDEALAHNAAVAMPLADAETRIAYGRFLRHTGRVTRARVALHDALQVLAPTGARRLIAVATEELAAAGGRPARPRHRSSTELTPQEYRVAALAATGLTNKEIAQTLFVAAKTVDHHLSATYAKLGITSRRELMRDWLDVARDDDSSRS